MNLNNYLAEKLNELIEGISTGDFDSPETVPSKYTYAHLWGLFSYARSLDGGRIYTGICSKSFRAITDYV